MISSFSLIGFPFVFMFHSYLKILVTDKYVIENNPLRSSLMIININLIHTYYKSQIAQILLKIINIIKMKNILRFSSV